MKKIICALIVLVSVITLAGCSNKVDYTLDDTAKSTNIAKAWLNDVEYSTSMYNKADETKNHYKAYLPTDIKASLRLNIVDVTKEFNNSFSHFAINYASCSSLADAFKNQFVNEIKETVVSEALAEAKLPSTWQSSIKAGQDIIDNAATKTVVIYTVYLPVRIESYYIKDKVALKVLNSFIICPITFGITYKTDGVLENVKDDVKSLPDISFEYNGVLK